MSGIRNVFFIYSFNTLHKLLNMKQDRSLTHRTIIVAKLQPLLNTRDMKGVEARKIRNRLFITVACFLGHTNAAWRDAGSPNRNSLMQGVQ